ncbi:hypothetical protein A3I27_04675 [Candidatus Giovannonibacteria bacterium RIFCSPLOWO2_02_FULL_43_11b]|nr:MAG: hypothetical protein A2739_02415 [Candidatus Giovannonibacteria bacterium RIFCSPHIGHO2_01_FULL_43_100]OGF67260.1 MAG: hypothetical protein A3B97_00410 [Candidatus Giovannonibacteria bacterium RIFCSPHIGHO2_02_FULL_43_32]OGF90320.1 MAG: hypothetical protein A3I27_04675 [Candidatus Giovannonibacteria bacterium RIFCSPLOWO2_02_FULL_43_11b]OGF92180.1 MAG: hypothetical protein A3H04_01660 [Candidatus Giovannonibacteria bacterium RIFCSPLOWO2_12_FULL_43_11c]
MKKNIILAASAVFAIALMYYAAVYLPEFIGVKAGKRLTGLEIAKKTALFLDKTLKPDGSFELLYECTKNDSACKAIESSGPPHTGQILRAYYHLWKTTSDPKYKEKADRAMGFVLDACEKNSDYCEWNYFALHDFYMDFKDDRFKKAMLKSADKFLNESLENTVNNNNGIKLAALYHVTGEKKYLDKLDKTAKDILDGKFSRGLEFFVTSDYYVVRNNDIHIIWSVYLPAYAETQNVIYLNAVKDFFEKSHITEHLGKFDSGAGLGIGNLAKAWEVLLDLTEIAQGRNPHYGDLQGSMRTVPEALASHDEPDDDPEVFYAQAKAIGQHILNERWDSQYNRQFNADYGFLHAANKSKNNKSPFYSGWLIQLYLRMLDDSFEPPTDGQSP